MWACARSESCQIAAALSPPHVLLDTGSGCWNAGCKSSRSLAALELLTGKRRTRRRSQAHIGAFCTATKFKMIRENTRNAVLHSVGMQQYWNSSDITVACVVYPTRTLTDPFSVVFCFVVLWGRPMKEATYSSHELWPLCNAKKRWRTTKVWASGIENLGSFLCFTYPSRLPAVMPARAQPQTNHTQFYFLITRAKL